MRIVLHFEAKVAKVLVLGRETLLGLEHARPDLATELLRALARSLALAPEHAQIALALSTFALYVPSGETASVFAFLLSSTSRPKLTADEKERHLMFLEVVEEREGCGGGGGSKPAAK